MSFDSLLQKLDEQKPEEKVEVIENVETSEVVTEPKVEITELVEKIEEIDFLEPFNKKYETQFKDYDELGTLIKTSGSLKEEREALKKELELLDADYEKIYESNNPEKLYGGTEGYKKKLMRDKAESLKYNPAVTERIINNDIDKIDPVSLIMFDIENRSKDLTGDIPTLKAYVLKKIGVNIENEKDRFADAGGDPKDFNVDWVYKNLQPEHIAELKLLATEAREKFRELKNIEIPEFKSYKDLKSQKKEEITKKQEELLKNWGDRVDALNDFKVEFKFTDIKGKEDVYQFVDNEFNKSISQAIKDEILKSGIEPSQENINKLRTNIENKFWSNPENRTKALKKIIEDAKSRQEEELDNKVHNEKPINKQVAPDKKVKNAEQDEFFSKRKQKADLNSIWQ